MRSAAGAPANSAIAERKPDRAFGFPEGVAAGLNPLVLRSNIRLVSALTYALLERRELHQAPVKGGLR